MYEVMPSLDWLSLAGMIFGSGGFVALYIAIKTRKSEVKKAEASALETIQAVYDKFVSDTEKKFDELKKEIERLEGVVEDYKARCGQCSNFRQKK